MSLTGRPGETNQGVEISPSDQKKWQVYTSKASGHIFPLKKKNKKLCLNKNLNSGGCESLKVVQATVKLTNIISYLTWNQYVKLKRSLPQSKK